MQRILRYAYAIIIGSCLAATSSAQSYQRLHQDFTTPKHIWYQQYFDRMVDIRSSKVQRQIVESFSNNHASALYERFSNGSVLHDQELERYLNNIGDSLLAGDALQYQVRIYPIWNSQPNAFSHGSGTLFVTLGLLANIENEAALAFVIGHEVAHFEHKHAFKQHENNIRNRQIRALGMQGDPHTKDQHVYSREVEIEADSLGLRYLLNSPYHPSEAHKAFNAILNYPTQYTGLAFQPSWFNNRFERYDQDAFSASSTTIAIHNPNSTHPNPSDRIWKVRNAAMRNPQAGQAIFLQPQNQFQHIQARSRSLLTRTLLYDFQVYDAIHNAYYHLQQDPNAIEHEHAILQVLRLLLYARSSKSPDIEARLNYKTVGQPNVIQQFFSQLTHRELVKRVLYYTVDRALQHPDDTLIQHIAVSVIDKIILDHRDTYRYAIQEHPDIERYQKKAHRNIAQLRYDYQRLQQRSLLVAPQLKYYDHYSNLQSTYENVNRSDRQYDNLRPHLQALAHHNIGMLTLESPDRDPTRVLHDIYTLNEWRKQQQILAPLHLPSFNQAEAEAVMKQRGARQLIFVEVNNLVSARDQPSPSRVRNYATIEVYHAFQHRKLSERSFSYLNLWPDLIPLHIYRSIH